jgi:hypothetical protein
MSPPDYAPLEETANNLIWLYGIILFFNTCFFVMMWRKYIQKKSKPGLYLSIVFTFYVFILLIIYLGFLQAYITGYKKELYMFSLAAGYTGIATANCVLILFALSVFKTKKDNKFAIKYIIISLISAVLLALPQNYYGWTTSYIPEEWRIFRTLTTGILMLTSFIVYGRIFKEAQRASKFVEEAWAKKGFQYISYAQLCWIILFLMLVADLVYDLLADAGGYTFFYYIAWSMMVVATYFFYIGYLMPDWFKKKYPN